MKRLFVLIFALVLCLPLAVWAQDNQAATNAEDQTMEATALKDERKELKAQRKAEFTAARGERIKNRCSALKTKIDQLASRIATLKEARGQLVSHKIEKLESLIERLNNQGVDTTTLTEDVAALKAMSDELTTLWVTYQTAIEALAEARCADPGSSQAFHEALEAAKAAMADIRGQYIKIKDFIKNDIKPDLQLIRQALADDNGTS